VETACVSEPPLAAREPFAGLGETKAQPLPLQGLSLAFVKDRACISVAARRGRGAELLALGRAAFGLELPERPRLTPGAPVSFVWSGRQVWIASSKEWSPAQLEERLRAAFADTASLVDQSDSRSSLILSGGQARTLLSRLIPVDLHPRAFQVHDTALTLIGAINGQVTLLDATPSFELTVSRAYVGSFWESLQEAAVGLSHGGSAPGS
jgi:methylglutamate dehydrogenase subunit D